ncbi:MAG: hypothetical protein JXA69_15015, partial [Phycisphaerae bacterium]|nr:hypothetical protein [Phycisphaerae bacterium]
MQSRAACWTRSERFSIRSIALAGIVAALWTPSTFAQRPLGIDVSAWQGDLSQQTWNNVYSAGRVFA